MPRETIRFTVPKALAGARLDEAIETLTGDISKSQAQKAVRRGDVTIDGARIVRSNGRVNKGATIAIERDRSPARVLHEDEHILVVSKQTGVLTHGADRASGDDLAGELDERFGPLPTSRGLERPGIVHRLDRETSGLLVVARTEAALERLQDQFRERTVHKVYLALVHGVPSNATFDCAAPIGPVPGTLDRQGVDEADGKEALTEFEVSASFERHALLRCTIRTGRRHQIRVHLAHLGRPVLGDELYGTKQVVPLPKGCAPPPRLALHAAELAFDHPVSGERVRFTDPLPADLERVRAELARR